MSKNKVGRKRKVQLTDEALEILKDKIRTVWDEQSEGKKITWAHRAYLMGGMSESTAKRILRQVGNDRNVLKDAFEYIGIDWDDSYCVLIGSEPITNEPKPSLSIPDNNKPIHWGFALSLFPIFLIITLGMANLGNRVTNSSPNIEFFKAQQLVATSESFYNDAQYEKAIEQAEKALIASQKINDPKMTAEALTVQGKSLAALGDLESAIDYFKQAYTFWEYYGNYSYQATALEAQAVAEARLLRFDESKKHFDLSKDLYYKQAQRKDAPAPYVGLGALAAINGDFEEARRQFDEAEVCLELSPDKAQTWNIRALRALLLRDEGHLDKALRELLICLDYWKEKKHKRWIANTLRQISSIYALKGNTTSCRQCLIHASKLYQQVNDIRNFTACQDLLHVDISQLNQLSERVEEYL